MRVIQGDDQAIIEAQEKLGRHFDLARAALDEADQPARTFPVKRHEVDERNGAAFCFEIGLEDQGIVAVSAPRGGPFDCGHAPMPVFRCAKQGGKQRPGIETRPA